MNIGIFTDYFVTQGASAGGVGKVTYSLACELAKRGNKVFVFTNSSSCKDEIRSYKNLTVICFGKTFRIGNTDFSIKLLYGSLRYKLDIANAHSGTMSLLAATIYSMIKKRPLVFSHHGDPMIYGSIFRRILITLYNSIVLPNILRYANTIVALSKSVVNASNILKKFKSKIKIIPNAVSFEENDVSYTKEEAKHILEIPSTDKIILFVGALVERKAPHILLKAMRRIVKEVPTSKAFFVGPPMGNMSKYEKMARDFGVADHVVFKGFVSKEELQLYYKAADVFVLPSLSEGIPIALLDALSNGVPVVVSNLEQYNEIIIDNFNGLLAKKGDPKDFAKKIIHLLSDEKTRKVIGQNAKTSIKLLRWSEVAKKYERLYKILIAGN